MLIIFFQVPSGSVPVAMMEEKEKQHKEEEALTGGEREALVFQEGTKVYRCMSDPEGYQCPICSNVFQRLGRHMNTSECGKDIDTKRFISDLKKYLKVQNAKKHKSKNPEIFRKKKAERKKNIKGYETG